MRFPSYSLPQFSLKKSQIGEDTSLNWFLLQSGPKLNVSFQTQLAALSVTSWSSSRPTRELLAGLGWPMFRTLWLAAGKCCVKEMTQAAMAVLSPSRMPRRKECLQPGLRFRARMSTKAHRAASRVFEGDPDTRCLHEAETFPRRVSWDH